MREQKKEGFYVEAGDVENIFFKQIDGLLWTDDLSKEVQEITYKHASHYNE